MKTLNWKLAGILGAVLLGLTASGHAQPGGAAAVKLDDWQTLVVNLGPGEKPDTVSLFSIDFPVPPKKWPNNTDPNETWRGNLMGSAFRYQLQLSTNTLEKFDPKSGIRLAVKTMERMPGTKTFEATDVPLTSAGYNGAAVLATSSDEADRKTACLISIFKVRSRILTLSINYNPDEAMAKQLAMGILTSARAADGVSSTKDGFTIEDLRVGDGPVAKAGKMVTVHYRGTLADGTVFDESYKRGQPFQFNLGAGQVIKGWDQGVAGMKVGGKRKLVIPPALAYGDAGAGGVIPPNSTLTFEVELLGVG